MLFSEAIKKFVSWKSLGRMGKETLKGYNYTLRGFCLYLRDPDIEDMSLDDVTGWFELQIKLEWDQNGLANKAAALRKFLEYCRLQEWDVLNPELVPIPDVEYREARVISEEEYVKLLAVIPKNGRDPRHVRNEAIIRMLWDCGSRNSELLSLNIDKLQTQKAVIKTEKDRGRYPMRPIFWTESTQEMLNLWLEHRDRLANRIPFSDIDALFISISGRKYGTRLTHRGVGAMLRVYSKKAGIPTANAHSFRHHCGEEWAEQGVNDAVMSSLLGHKSLNSSFRYTRLKGQAQERVYRNLNPDRKFGELPAKAFQAPATAKEGGEWKKERAMLEIERMQRLIDQLSSNQQEEKIRT